MEHIKSSHSITDVLDFAGDESEASFKSGDESSESDGDGSEGCEESEIETDNDDYGADDDDYEDEERRKKRTKKSHGGGGGAASKSVNESGLINLRNLVSRGGLENMHYPERTWKKFMKLNNYGEPVFDQWINEEFEILSSKARISYEPSHKFSRDFSCKFVKDYKIQQAEVKENECDWKSLKLYQGAVVNGKHF